MLEYIKVEETLNKTNTRLMKEIKYERKQIVCLRKDQIISAIKETI